MSNHIAICIHSEIVYQKEKMLLYIYDSPLLHQMVQVQRLYVDLLLVLENAMAKCNNLAVQKQDAAANVSSRQKLNSIQEEKLIQLLERPIL